MILYSEHLIHQDQATIWRALSDYSNIYKFHPLLKGSQYIEDSCIAGEGAMRQCFMLDGSYLKEKVTDWKEGESYTVEIFETTMPIKSATAAIGTRQIDGQSAVAFIKMDVTPKYAVLQPFMYTMFKFVAIPSILKGLEKMLKKEQVLIQKAA